MPGIPINELVSLNRPVENNDTTTYFPLVYSNGITYKSTIKQIFYNGAVTTDVIANNAVTGEKIINNAVTTQKINNGSISTVKILDHAVISDKLNNAVGDEAVISSVIRSGAVTTSKLDSTVGSEAVNTSVIRDCSITTAKLDTALFNQAVATNTIRDCAVTSDKLNRKVGSEAVTTDTVRNDAITPSKISFLNNTISTNDTNILISNGNEFTSVTPTGNICVTNTGNISIKAGEVDSSELANDAVTTAKLDDSSVTTAKLADDAVTTAKIANDAVIDVKIKDNNVTSSKIADDAVTGPKIADDAVTSPKIAASAVGNSELATDAVIEVKIKDGNVTSRKIASSAVGSDQIVNGAVIGTKIPDNTIDNNKINNSCNYTINGLDITSPNLGINSVDYKFPSSATDGRFLKHNSGGNLEWVLPSNFVPQADAVVLNKVLPVGTILPYGSETLPTDGKFLPCDGTERLKTDYPYLFDIIGDKYGTPSSSGYFKLPNLKGRVPVGTGDNYFGAGLIGQTGGRCCATYAGNTASYALNISQMPAHSHTLYGNDGSTDNQTKAPRLKKDDAESAAAADTIGSTGGGQPHYHGFSFSTDIVQPYLTAEYIIKAIPDEVIQYNANITAGLSALNGAGQQTTSVDLSTTEIGLNVTNDFSYDGADSLQIRQGAVTPGKLSTGAPNWTENGAVYVDQIIGRESADGLILRADPESPTPTTGGPQIQMISADSGQNANQIYVKSSFVYFNTIATTPARFAGINPNGPTDAKDLTTKEYVDNIGYPAYKASIPQSSHVAQSFTFYDPTTRVLYPSGVTIPGRNLSYIVSNGSWTGSGSDNDLFVKLSIQFFNSKGQALSSKYSDAEKRYINTSNGRNQTKAGVIVIPTFTLTNSDWDNIFMRISAEQIGGNTQALGSVQLFFETLSNTKG